VELIEVMVEALFFYILCVFVLFSGVSPRSAGIPSLSQVLRKPVSPKFSLVSEMRKNKTKLIAF